MPRAPRRLEEDEGAVHVGLDELPGRLEGTVDVRLGGEVDDDVHVLGQRVDEPGVADVAVHERKFGSSATGSRLRTLPA